MIMVLVGNVFFGMLIFSLVTITLESKRLYSKKVIPALVVIAMFMWLLAALIYHPLLVFDLTVVEEGWGQLLVMIGRFSLLLIIPYYILSHNHTRILCGFLAPIGGFVIFLTERFEVFSFVYWFDYVFVFPMLASMVSIMISAGYKQFYTVEEVTTGYKRAIRITLIGAVITMIYVLWGNVVFLSYITHAVLITKPLWMVLLITGMVVITLLIQQLVYRTFLFVQNVKYIGNVRFRAVGLLIVTAAFVLFVSVGYKARLPRFDADYYVYNVLGSSHITYRSNLYEAKRYYNFDAAKDENYYSFYYIPYRRNVTLMVETHQATYEVAYEKTSNGFIQINLTDIFNTYSSVQSIYLIRDGQEERFVTVYLKEEINYPYFLEVEEIPDSDYYYYVIED